jgi:hypothetical protein
MTYPGVQAVVELVVVVGPHLTTNDATHVFGQAHVERGSQTIGTGERGRTLAIGKAVGVLHAVDGVGSCE